MTSSDLRAACQRDRNVGPIKSPGRRSLRWQAKSWHDRQRLGNRANRPGQRNHQDAGGICPRPVAASSSWDRWAVLLEEAGYVAVKARLAGRPRRPWPRPTRARRCSRARPSGRSPTRPCLSSASSTEAGRDRPLLRRSAHPDPGRTRPVRRLGRRRPGAVPRRPAPAPLGARAGRTHLNNPAKATRAVPLTYQQFRYAIANAVSEQEAQDLYHVFAVPGSGEPVSQAGTANLNPWTEARVDTRNPDRGPLLVISGEKDRTVPRAVAHGSFTLGSSTTPGITEFTEIPDRGHFANDRPRLGVRSPKTALALRASLYLSERENCPWFGPRVRADPARKLHGRLLPPAGNRACPRFEYATQLRHKRKKNDHV